jgi:hypothetical protein
LLVLLLRFFAIKYDLANLLDYLGKCASLFNMIINPIYLLTANMIHAIKYKIDMYLFNIIFMIQSWLMLTFFQIYFGLEYGFRGYSESNYHRHGEFMMYFIIPYIIVFFGIIERIILEIIYRLKKRDIRRKQNLQA